MLVIGFNSEKYNINLIKLYFVKEIAKADGEDKASEIFVARKENNYMFLTANKFKFLYIHNHLDHSLSYEAWYKSLRQAEKINVPIQMAD